MDFGILFTYGIDKNTNFLDRLIILQAGPTQTARRVGGAA
jgi:hypothetical protein